MELLSVRFMAAGEDLVRAHVSYRYNVVKARLQLMTARLADINAMVRAAGFAIVTRGCACRVHRCADECGLQGCAGDSHGAEGAGLDDEPWASM